LCKQKTTKNGECGRQILLFNFCCFSFPQFVKINDFFWYETYPNTITDFIDDIDCEDSTLQQAQPSVTAASEFFDEPNVIFDVGQEESTNFFETIPSGKAITCVGESCYSVLPMG
jgi:hypothetical protein